MKSAVEEIEVKVERSRNQSKERDSCTVDSGDVDRPTGYHPSVLREPEGTGTTPSDETIAQAAERLSELKQRKLAAI